MIAHLFSYLASSTKNIPPSAPQTPQTSRGNVFSKNHAAPSTPDWEVPDADQDEGARDGGFITPLRESYRDAPVPHKLSSAPNAKLTNSARAQALLDMFAVKEEGDQVEKKANEAQMETMRAEIKALKRGKKFVSRKLSSVFRLGTRMADAAKISLSPKRGRPESFITRVAKHYQVSKQTMSLIWDKRHSGDTAAHPLPGRPNQSTPSKLASFKHEFNGAEGASLRTMAMRMAGKTSWKTNFKSVSRNGPGRETIRKLKNQVVIRMIRKRPHFDEAVKAKRLKFVEERLQLDAVSSTFDQPQKQPNCFLPGEEIDDALLSQTDAAHGHAPKVFVSAVITRPTLLNPTEVAAGAKPQFDPVQNGKVLLMRHTNVQARKNRRRDPETGVLIELADDTGVPKPYTMNAARYAESYAMERGYADAVTDYVAKVIYDLV